MFALFTLASFASAASPTFMRLPTSPLLPFEEITMTKSLIPSGCGYVTWCTAIVNNSPSWLAVEIPDKGTSKIATNRVFVDGPMVIGVYVNNLPQLTGTTTVVLNNQTITIPVIVGEFIAAIPPCRDWNSIPRGFIQVDDSKSLTVQSRTLNFRGDDVTMTTAWDANKDILVSVPLGGYAHFGGVNSVTWTMWTENGNPAAAGQPWAGIQIGNAGCRN